MIMEVAIALQNEPDDPGGERMKEGDIIVLRPQATGIGSKETKIFLWLRLEGLFTRIEFDPLKESIYEPDEDTGVRYDKRRYCIPFARLQIVDPSFDINRARDSADLYQPYLVTDAEDYTFVSTNPPFQVSGLVYDKAVGDYI